MLDKAAQAELKAMQAAGVRLSTADVVERARSANSALHRFFTWNDGEAAHAFRLIQARTVIKAVIRITPIAPIQPTRTVVQTAPAGPPKSTIQTVLAQEMDRPALLRLRMAIRKMAPEYGHLFGFGGLFAEIDRLLEARVGKPAIAGADREPNGSMSRFKPYTHKGGAPDRERASLPSDHPAVTEARTLFPSRVFSAEKATSVLVPGHSNAKVGDYVTKGPWAGMSLFTLTLEERHTCPRSCHLWAECYGNGMPLARRWAYDEHFPALLMEDVAQKAKEHPAGFVVRLHVLGDFPDVEYVQLWDRMLEMHPELHVFGYTAHARDSEIGKSIWVVGDVWLDRFAIRYSVAPDTKPEGFQATTIWRDARGKVPEGVVCPASSGDTEACGTCGLCWSTNMIDQRIVFLGHGMKRGKSTPPDVEMEADTDELPPLPTPIPPPLPAPRPTPSPAPPPLPAPARVVVRGDDAKATELAADLTPAERKTFLYMSPDGIPKAITGPAMGMLIRQLWEKLGDDADQLILLDCATEPEMAKLTGLGRMVRGRVAAKAKEFA